MAQGGPKLTVFATSAFDPNADAEARFAASVTGFGQLLKGGRYAGDWSIDDATALAEGARGTDPFGYRNEFVNLTRLAKTAAAMVSLR